MNITICWCSSSNRYSKNFSIFLQNVQCSILLIAPFNNVTINKDKKDTLKYKKLLKNNCKKTKKNKQMDTVFVSTKTTNTAVLLRPSASHSNAEGTLVEWRVQTRPSPRKLGFS